MKSSVVLDKLHSGKINARMGDLFRRPAINSKKYSTSIYQHIDIGNWPQYTGQQHHLHTYTCLTMYI